MCSRNPVSCRGVISDGGYSGARMSTVLEWAGLDIRPCQRSMTELALTPPDALL